MTHPTLDRMAKNRAKLLALVADLDDETLSQSHEDGWTIREVLTHLLNAEEDHCAVAEVIARGDLDRLPVGLELNAHNERRVAERGHLAREALLDALAAQRERTVALFEGMTPEQLDAEGPHPILGDISVNAIFRVIAMHDTLHVRDIKAIVAAAE